MSNVDAPVQDCTPIPASVQVKLEAFGRALVERDVLAAGAPKVIVGGLESTRKKVESEPVAVCAVAVCSPSPVT